MPYLIEERKKALNQGNRHNLNEGDANYLYTQFFLKRWKLESTYKQIHFFKKLAAHPSFDTEFQEIDHSIRLTGMLDSDRQAARELAFLEFYRRVGSKYEDKKIELNGDVYPNFQEEGDR